MISKQASKQAMLHSGCGGKSNCHSLSLDISSKFVLSHIRAASFTVRHIGSEVGTLTRNHWVSIYEIQPTRCINACGMSDYPIWDQSLRLDCPTREQLEKPSAMMSWQFHKKRSLVSQLSLPPLTNKLSTLHIVCTPQSPTVLSHPIAPALRKRFIISI